MEEAKRALFDRAIRKYALKELVKPSTLGAGQHNLVELVGRYPGHGLSFKVFKKTWPEGSFWHVKSVQMFVSMKSCFDHLLPSR